MQDRYDIRSASLCPFAKVCQLGVSEVLEEGTPLARAVEICLSGLRQIASQESNLDGFVLHLRTGPSYSFDRLVRVANTILKNASDWKECAPEEWSSIVNSPRWTFSTCNEKWYPLVFSSLYDTENSRYSGHAEISFFLFLREASFDRIAQKYGGIIPDRIRDYIRAGFQFAGKEYDVGISLSPYECRKVVKPPVLGGQIVEWWNAGWINST
ncbi:hypothetical protein [Aestuariivirga sp.]|uniref:hypothetical protein n=1 Tax=Aestuariivirga sp. TaxID=2650926 RepID=UPI003BAC2003